jgi:hypothetical protein
MRVFIGILLIIGLSSASAQQTVRAKSEGIVEHGYLSATVTANNARPLALAIGAVRAEYGWVVDYEERRSSRR